MNDSAVKEIKRNEMKRLNLMIQKLESMVYKLDHDINHLTKDDALQLRVYLYDLKLRIIKDKK